MNASGDGIERLLLLGRDEVAYGAHTLASTADGRVALALSVGADPDSPGLAYKGDPDLPNEDAVLAWADGERVMLVVADAHFGCHASHALLEALARTSARPPADPAGLLRLLDGASVPPDPALPDSATSLLAVILRRDLGAGFGCTIGDATCTLVGAGRDASELHPPTRGFYRPAEHPAVGAAAPALFEFDAPAGGLLVAFTDGVDRCCYREPERSPRAADRAALFEHTGADAGAYARALMHLSLDGLPGEPGGQDNIAIAVAST